MTARGVTVGVWQCRMRKCCYQKEGGGRKERERGREVLREGVREGVIGKGEER